MSNRGRNNQGGDRSSGGGDGERRDGARGRSPWDGSSTFSRSSSASSSDRGEMPVVAGNRQVSPSLVDVASSDNRLSKRTVSDGHTKSVSSDLALARTSAIAIAAAKDKATLDDLVKRAYVKLPHKDLARISVLPFPTSLNKHGDAQQHTCSDRSAMSDI